MLAVLASQHDDRAISLIERWGGRASLISCEDLSTEGWRFEPGRPWNGSAVVAGDIVAVADLEGVLTLRSSVFEEELLDVAPEERPYVAAEMNAFLLAWLCALPCRVVNRPSPTSLSGPGWRREQWIRVASSLGMPVVSSRRVVGASAGSAVTYPNDRPLGGIPVVVVGGRAFHHASPEVGESAVRLARHAGVDLLDVWFDDVGPDARMVDASPSVPLRDTKLADSVFELLIGEPAPPFGKVLA